MSASSPQDPFAESVSKGLIRQGPSKQEEQQSPVAPYPQGGNFPDSFSVSFTVHLLTPKKFFPLVPCEKHRILVDEGPALTGLDARGDVFLWAEVAFGHPIAVLIGCHGVKGAG